MGITPPLLLIDGMSEPPVDATAEVYPSVGDLLIYLEPWFVDEPHAIFDATGARLKLETDGKTQRLVESAAPPRPDLVRAFLMTEIQNAIKAEPDRSTSHLLAGLEEAPLEALWRAYHSLAGPLVDEGHGKQSMWDKLKRLLGRH